MNFYIVVKIFCDIVNVFSFCIKIFVDFIVFKFFDVIVNVYIVVKMFFNIVNVFSFYIYIRKIIVR